MPRDSIYRHRIQLFGHQDDTNMDRASHLLPLGFQRLRLLDCLGGSSPHSAGVFEPIAGADIFTAFRDYVASLCEELDAESDPMTLTLLAAARFLTGDFDSAFVIIDYLPAKAVKLDHGAGFCRTMPQIALRTALPLPSPLDDISRWLAGSAEQAQLGEWLAAHRTRLLWNERNGVYLHRETHLIKP